MNATGENVTMEVIAGASGAAGDDWRWMVAEDPAFYLEEPARPVETTGVVGEGR